MVLTSKLIYNFYLNVWVCCALHIIILQIVFYLPFVFLLQLSGSLVCHTYKISFISLSYILLLQNFFFLPKKKKNQTWNRPLVYQLREPSRCSQPMVKYLTQFSICTESRKWKWCLKFLSQPPHVGNWTECPVSTFVPNRCSLCVFVEWTIDRIHLSPKPSLSQIKDKICKNF